MEGDSPAVEPTEVLGVDGEVLLSAPPAPQDGTVLPLGSRLSEVRGGGLGETYPAPKKDGALSGDAVRRLEKFFIPVSVKGAKGDYKLLKFTKREVACMEAFLETGSLTATGQALGLEPRTVKRILRRSGVKALLLERTHDRAIANRFSPEAVKARILSVAMGLEDATKNQVEALKIAQKMFGELMDNTPFDLAEGMEIGIVMRKRAPSEGR